VTRQPVTVFKSLNDRQSCNKFIFSCNKLLADVLPRCPKDLPVLVFTIKGKDNNSKDFTVRRQKVSDAHYWLTGVNDDGEPNNHLYQTVKIDKVALQALPENGCSLS